MFPREQIGFQINCDVFRFKVMFPMLYRCFQMNNRVSQFILFLSYISNYYRVGARFSIELCTLVTLERTHAHSLTCTLWSAPWIYVHPGNMARVCNLIKLLLMRIWREGKKGFANIWNIWMFAKRPLEVIILDQSCLFKVNKGQTYFISVYIYWNTDTRVEKYHFTTTVKILD